jgi:hypothetical protein
MPLLQRFTPVKSLVGGNYQCSVESVVRKSMNVSSVVVPGSIIAGFTTLGLQALTFDRPTQFATDVLTGDTQ